MSGLYINAPHKFILLQYYYQEIKISTALFLSARNWLEEWEGKICLGIFWFGDKFWDEAFLFENLWLVCSEEH